MSSTRPMACANQAVDDLLEPAPGTSAPRASDDRILVVGGDSELDAFVCALRQSHFAVERTPDAHQALVAARRTRFTLLLVNAQLVDTTGVELVRTFRAEHMNTSLIVSSHDQHRMPGALASRARGLASPRPTIAASDEARAAAVAERWAHYVMQVVHSAHDIKTIGTWARVAGVSRSVLYECCRPLHLLPQATRDFARMLRVVRRGGRVWRPEAALDCAETRTLNKMLARAGLARWHEPRVPTTEEYLARQHWVPEDNSGMQALRALLGYGRG